MKHDKELLVGLQIIDDYVKLEITLHVYVCEHHFYVPLDTKLALLEKAMCPMCNCDMYVVDTDKYTEMYCKKCNFRGISDRIWYLSDFGVDYTYY